MSLSRLASGETWLAAEVGGPAKGLVLQAAAAALEVNKLIADDFGSPAGLVREAPARRLETMAPAEAGARYRAVLRQRLAEAIGADPAGGGWRDWPFRTRAPGVWTA